MTLYHIFMSLACFVLGLNCTYRFLRDYPEDTDKEEIRYIVSGIIVAALLFLSYWYRDIVIDSEKVMIGVKIAFIFIVLTSIHMLHGASTVKFGRYKCFNIARVKIVTITLIIACTWAFFALPS